MEEGAQVDAKDKVSIDIYKRWQILHSAAIFYPKQLVYHPDFYDFFFQFTYAGKLLILLKLT